MENARQLSTRLTPYLSPLCAPLGSRAGRLPHQHSCRGPWAWRATPAITVAGGARMSGARWLPDGSLQQCASLSWPCTSLTTTSKTCANFTVFSIYRHRRTVLGNVLIRSYSSGGGYDSTNSGHRWRDANRTAAMYMVAIAIGVVGLSYAAVPLYRLFCQASGYGGTVNVADASEKVEKMVPVRERELTIRFDAGTTAAMQWQFKPHHKEIKLVPGETALAFYTARNPTDKPVTGVATYNVIPFEAGQYFNKIQCFCFEEQRLNPREQVDMPVFFYIDPEFNEDPAMAKVDTITLSYTFFESKEGDALYLPLQSAHTSS